MTHDELVKLAKEDAARVTLLSLEKAQLDQSDLMYQARKEEKEKMVRALAKQGVDLSIISVAAELTVEKALANESLPAFSCTLI